MLIIASHRLTTLCLRYQDWQSELLAWSAHRVGHHAAVTRIASGCTEAEQKRLAQRYAENDVAGLRVHFAPKKLMPNGQYYKYANKPTGLHHWLVHADPPVPDDAVIVLLDPDMVLVKPFPAVFKHTDARTTYRNNDFSARYPGTKPFRVKNGFPLGQKYGYLSAQSSSAPSFLHSCRLVYAKCNTNVLNRFIATLT